MSFVASTLFPVLLIIIGWEDWLYPMHSNFPVRTKESNKGGSRPLGNEVHPRPPAALFLRLSRVVLELDAAVHKEITHLCAGGDDDQ
jgi:hypothetical protein